MKSAFRGIYIKVNARHLISNKMCTYFITALLTTEKVLYRSLVKRFISLLITMDNNDFPAISIATGAINILEHSQMYISK